MNNLQMSNNTTEEDLILIHTIYKYFLSIMKEYSGMNSHLLRKTPNEANLI